MQLAGLAVAVVLVALAVGWMFGRMDEPRAARLLLSDDVEQQPESEQRPGPDPALPTSGPQRGEPRCGVADEPVDGDTQVATLAAGVVIVQHGEDLDDATTGRLHALADRHERVLVAPSGALGPRQVVATAWRHRLGPAHLDPDRVETFVLGHADRAPDPAPCP